MWNRLEWLFPRSWFLAKLQTTNYKCLTVVKRPKYYLIEGHNWEFVFPFDENVHVYICTLTSFPCRVSLTIAISSIEAALLSRVLSCGGGLTKTVCFMAVTEAAVNNFLDRKQHTNKSLLYWLRFGLCDFCVRFGERNFLVNSRHMRIEWKREHSCLARQMKG